MDTNTYNELFRLTIMECYADNITDPTDIMHQVLIDNIVGLSSLSNDKYAEFSKLFCNNIKEVLYNDRNNYTLSGLVDLVSRSNILKHVFHINRRFVHKRTRRQR